MGHEHSINLIMPMQCESFVLGNWGNVGYEPVV